MTGTEEAYQSSGKEEMMRIIMVAICLALASGCAGMERKETDMAAHDRLPGYLSLEILPDSATLIPPPPAPGSTAFALDEEVKRSVLPLRDTPIWDMAAHDSDLSMQSVADGFSCALKIALTKRETPALFRLLERSLSDVKSAVSIAKKKYGRPRPFVAGNERICTPEYERRMRKSGSYPSAHTAAGWAWALILSELAPERGDEVLARGISLGDSRIVCNVHWLSDVNEARIVAAAVVARLHSDPAFRADLELARAELAASRAKGVPPAGPCSRPYRLNPVSR